MFWVALSRGQARGAQCLEQRWGGVGELSLLPQTFTTKVQVVPNATPGVWLATGSDDDDDDDDDGDDDEDVSCVSET